MPDEDERWNAKLTRVLPNGQFSVEAAQTQTDFNLIVACMQAEDRAERARAADAERLTRLPLLAREALRLEPSDFMLTFEHLEQRP